MKVYNLSRIRDNVFNVKFGPNYLAILNVNTSYITPMEISEKENRKMYTGFGIISASSELASFSYYCKIRFVFLNGNISNMSGEVDLSVLSKEEYIGELQKS